VIEEQRFELLRELARLLKKFGPAAFSDLAREFRDPAMAANLAEILEGFAEAGKRSEPRRGGEGGSGGSSLRGFLLKLRERDAEKGTMVTEVYEALLSRRVLPTLGQLREFAKDNGLGPVSATAREKALGPFVRSLAALPTEQVRSMMTRLSEESPRGDRTLEGWTELILKKRD
jgi:hypothetical protein